MNTIEPNRCYMFLADYHNQDRNGDFFSLIKVTVETVSHCGNWVFCEKQYQLVDNVNNSLTRTCNMHQSPSSQFNAKRGIRSSLLMTFDEAIRTRDAAMPKVGDLVKCQDIDPMMKKKFIVSKAMKAYVHLTCAVTGRRETVRHQDVHILFRAHENN